MTFLASVSPNGDASWNISTSPQYLALEELRVLSQQQEGGLVYLYDESRIAQRYAAQVLRFVIREGAGVDIVQPWKQRSLLEADAFDECTWPFLVCDGRINFEPLTFLRINIPLRYRRIGHVNDPEGVSGYQQTGVWNVA
jgi:hypothetical protein